jgi:methionine-rich copper-binding protein CopC
MKAVCALLLAVLAAALAAPVLAHTELVSAVPAPGATVADPISKLTLSFTESIAAGSSVQLFAGAFQEVQGVISSVSANVLTAEAAAPLVPGTYTVQWIAIGADGHPTAGSYQFAVSAPQARSVWPWALAIGLALAAIIASQLRLRTRRPPATLL